MLFQCESRHLGDISLNHPARYTGGTRGRPVLSRGPGGSWRVAAVPRGTDSPGERKISSSRLEAHARLDPISARNLRRLPWAHALGAAPPVCQADWQVQGSPCGHSGEAASMPPENRSASSDVSTERHRGHLRTPALANTGQSAEQGHPGGRQ